MPSLTVRGKIYTCLQCGQTDTVLFEDGLQEISIMQREYDHEISHLSDTDDPEFLYALDVLCDN